MPIPRLPALFCLFIAIGLFNCTSEPSEVPEDEVWQSLFDGATLDGWHVKLTGHEVDEDIAETFRADNGVLRVSYADYDHFDSHFGHIFYETPFGYYRLRMQYRFVGEQLAGGPAWAYANSGIMVHAQAPETMGLEQDFPISVEVQFLGQQGEGPRPTANLCTPGTHVVMGDSLHTAHCTTSTSPTFPLYDWVNVEVEVFGDSLIVHHVNGEEVLRYAQPQVGGGAVNGFDPAFKLDGQPLTSGYIALQSESHPVEFRDIELLNLQGCMDPEAATYKSYFLASDPAQCMYSDGD